VKWQRRFSSPETKRQYVRGLFATIADRYDLITVLLSGGLDRRWKAKLVAAIDGSDRQRVLDLACGTGDIAFAVAARGSRVVGLDITHRMLQLASGKPQASRRVSFVTGDMMALPFPDASFDVITTGYGLRNVPDLGGALREMHRVLRPGGRMLALDFDKPANPAVRAIYLTYLTVVGSALGWILHRDPDTYRYIPESIRRYPGAAGVSTLAERAGFSTCGHVPVLGGLMAMHSATK
jgi:demethylmenaquinone methyltransferase / 2-methoxy-6-polyprenyl-1,4-benzoquinol methylase